jgi:putative flippase GtrA
MSAIKNFYNTFINNGKYKSIIKFGCVGCLNTMLDFGMFSLLNSFLFNKHWTFNDTKTNKKTTKEIIQFIVVNLASLSVSLIGLSILMKDNSMNSFFAKIIAMVLAQVVNFLGYRFWVFGETVKSQLCNKELA